MNKVFVVLGLMCVMCTIPAAAPAALTERNEHVFFTATEHQLLPTPEQVFDAEFEKVYNEFTEAVRRKDLSVIDRFINDSTKSSLEDYGKSAFYDYWNLHNDPDQSGLWAEMEEIIELGGTYKPEWECFIAPYTFNDWPDEFDVFEYYVVIDKEVKVYEEEDLSSNVVDYLNYNIMKFHDNNKDNFESHDLVRIKTPSGTYGYIQKLYIRSPRDYAITIRRNDIGEWKIQFFLQPCC